MVDEQLVNIRHVSGINQSDDARISDPGAYLITQNLWSKNSTGLLAKRPGSICVVDGRAVTTTTAPSTGPSGGIQVGGGISTLLTLAGTTSAGPFTLLVTSTNGFPSTGSVWVDCDTGNTFGGTPTLVNYTGTTATTFTGCTCASTRIYSVNDRVTSTSNAGIAVNVIVDVNLLPPGMSTTVAGSGGSIISTAAINTVTTGVTNTSLTGTRGIVPRINL